MRALSTSATGMMAQQFNLDVIANNLANVNTTGFKKASAHFQDLLYQNLRTPGATSGNGQVLPTGAQVGLGVTAGTTTADFTQGAMQTTGGDYDIAISGQGFLQVLLPDGTTGYTRDGSLTVDATGKLVTSTGYEVQPQIIIPPDKTSVTIGPDGTVSVTQAGQQAATQLGQIKLARFINPGGLQNSGNNIFLKTPASGDPTLDTPGLNGLGTLVQRSVETSNVQVVQEMINMITAQRAYETNSKAIQTADEMLQTADNIKR